MNSIDLFQIKIQNAQNELSIDENLLKEVVCHLLQLEKVISADVSLAIVDNATIHDLNRQYLEHDYATDVLSFLLECQLEADKQVPELRGSGKTIEGEIIVSAEMAVSMAKTYQWSASDELLLYIVHGLLHLCGYDDLSEDEVHLMRIKEQQTLDRWGLTIPRRKD